MVVDVCGIPTTILRRAVPVIYGGGCTTVAGQRLPRQGAPRINDAEETSPRVKRITPPTERISPSKRAAVSVPRPWVCDSPPGHFGRAVCDERLLALVVAAGRGAVTP